MDYIKRALVLGKLNRIINRFGGIVARGINWIWIDNLTYNHACIVVSYMDLHGIENRGVYPCKVNTYAIRYH